MNNFSLFFLSLSPESKYKPHYNNLKSQMIMKKYLAEMVGTMVLVLMGCGVAVSLGCDPVNNIPAVVGTALAFGLSVVAMAYTIGGISGCHINPAITLGCFLAGRMNGKDCGMYIVCLCWWCWVQQQRPMAPRTILPDSPLVSLWCWYTLYVFVIRALL